MLEEKGDLELSLMHLKETARREANLSASLDAWINMLRKVTDIEQRVGEQFTVVQVYTSALEKDINFALFGVSTVHRIAQYHVGRERTNHCLMASLRTLLGNKRGHRCG